MLVIDVPGAQAAQIVFFVPQRKSDMATKVSLSVCIGIGMQAIGCAALDLVDFISGQVRRLKRTALEERVASDVENR